jgi:hypothetical protein
MPEKEFYSPKELEEIINKRVIEERFIADNVLANFGIKAQQRPQIYRQASAIVSDLVKKSAKIDMLIKERYEAYVVMANNGVPMQERPEIYIDAYRQVFDTVVKPPGEPEEIKKEDE